MRKYISFKGEQLYYEVKGKGRTIVFLHGFLANGQFWNTISKRLSKRFRVIVIDLPGHGQSAPLGYVHSMELLADAVKAVIQDVGVRKILLIGHSMGGYVSMAFAEKFPDALLGLILINSTAKGDTEERKVSRKQLIKVLKQNKDKALQVLVPSLFKIKQRTTTWHIKKYLQWARECPLQGIIANLEGMIVRNEREIVLKFAPFPYLFLIGEYDPLFVVNEIKDEAMLGESGKFELIEDSGHMSPLEREEQTLKWIVKFEKRLKFQ